MSWTVGKGTVIGFVGVVVLLMLTAVISYYNIHRLNQNNHLLAHTYEVLNALADVFSTLKDAQIGQRGYIITGQNHFLEPHKEAVVHIQEQFRWLEQLLANDPTQQTYLTTLEQEVTSWLTFAEETLRLRKEQGFELARHLALTGTGREAMDNVRTLVGQMQRAGRELLQVRDQQSRHSLQVAVSTVFITTFLGLGIVGFAWYLWKKDVTRAEALYETTALLNTLVASAPIGIAFLDRKMCYRLINPPLANMSGLPVEAHIGQAMPEVAPHLATVAEPLFRKVLETGVPVVAYEFCNISAPSAGKKRYWLASWYPVPGHSGEMLGVGVVVQEITERKQMEQSLQSAYAASEQLVEQRTAELFKANANLEAITTLQRAILDSANYSIISTDLNGIVRTFNRAAERWLGYTSKELVDRETLLVIHDPKEIVERAQQLSGEIGNPVKPGFEVLVARARQGLVDEHEWSYVRKDGSRFPVLLSVTALRDPSGIATGFLGIASDLTERKQIEERLRQQQTELAHAQRLITIGEITATIAHELNQPLAALGNYIEGAAVRFRAQVETTPALGEMLEQMKRLVARAAQVIRSIRGLARKRDLEQEWVDINALIRETLWLIGTEVKRRQIKIALDLASNLPPLWGCRISLQQLLLNLILNGMEAMEGVEADHRRITVRILAKREGEIEISVSDTGPGFAPGMAARIFDPFVTTKKEGMGLGLSICRTITEAHGGGISADSTLGRGATFVVTLPIRRDEEHRAD